MSWSVQDDTGRVLIAFGWIHHLYWFTLGAVVGALGVAFFK